MKKRAILATISVLFLSSCVNSHYHYESSNTNKHKKVRISQISIGSISSSKFWRIGQREYFESELKKALESQSSLRVVRNSPYRINVDIYDYSGEARKKMGKFLGAKQYRIVQDFDVSAWYRIERRGAHNTIKQGKAHYTPYADTGSSKSYEEAKKLVVKKKLRGIAKKVASRVIAYFSE